MSAGSTDYVNLRAVAVARNRDGFLLGASWSHHGSFPHRLTHFYLGWWVLTIRTSGKRS